MAGADVIYIPCLLTSDTKHVLYEAGGFPSEAEAQKVLDIWRTERRTEPTAINVLTLFESAADWQNNR